MPRLEGWLSLALLLLPWVARAQGALPGSVPSSREEAHSLGRSLLIVFVLICVNGFFAMAEAAMLSVRRSRIEQLAEEGSRAAKVVHRLLAEPTRMISTIQVGMTLVGLFTAGAAAQTAVRPLTRLLEVRFAETAIAAHAGAIAFAVVILSVGLLSLVVGEITPKSFAIRKSEQISLLTAFPIRWLQILATPVVVLVTWLSDLLLRPLGMTAAFHPPVLGEDELRILVEQSEEQGVIEAEEKEMIHSIFDFGDTLVRQVMTPRLDIVAVEACAGLDAFMRIVYESGHSRLPVYDGTLENIVGLVHIKDGLAALTNPGAPKTVGEIMRPPYFIPENKRVDLLLAEFRRTKVHLAVVRDEYGTVTGLVTIEDLLEEIVGEIQDEYDKERGPETTQVDEKTMIVEGRMTLQDFNEQMGLEMPVEESDTLGGFVFGLLGHQPVLGETAQWEGFQFRVESTDGRRILKLRVVRTGAPKPEAGGDGSSEARSPSTPPPNASAAG